MCVLYKQTDTTYLIFFIHIFRESEDTILFMMKEIYTSMGIQTDGQIPQQTLTIERPSSSSVISPTIPVSPDKGT